MTGTVASDASAYVGVEMRLERERPSPGNASAPGLTGSVRPDASVRANGFRPAANGTVGRSGESPPAAA
ncbi:hypothetical protein, partial [Halogeometricum sp. CBA1124]|uniref:hypothetical protein n=1 Tax=Halogeometricum sp. CBA1124 TaxID=2668071 RepID=UPI0014290150